MRRRRPVAVGVAVMVSMVVGVRASHQKMLYYNITAVHPKAPASAGVLAAPCVRGLRFGPPRDGRAQGKPGADCTRGHRVEANGRAVPQRPVKDVGQIEEPGERGGAPGARGVVLSKVQSVDQQMRVGNRQLRTCRRTRPGKLCARSPRPYCAPGYSGNPAFRRPSINSFAFGCPPRVINADIVKAGSISSTRAAASCASASRPRWAKADARQR
jgi:hypothetical protein